MKTAHYIAAALALLLGACGAEPDQTDKPDGSATVSNPPPEPPELVDMLVDRFDAPACQGAKPVAMMRKTGPEGVNVVRSYTAPVACIEELVAAFGGLGFSEESPDIYQGGLPDGNKERIRVEIADDRSIGGIEWEVDVE